jgi:hypothetical protein
MATRALPANPSLKSLKHQAKQLLHGHQAGQREACERLHQFHPRFAAVAPDAIRQTPAALADALLVVAREYGYDSWPRLVEAVIGQSDWPDFAAAEGWRWVVAPDLRTPMGTNGAVSSPDWGMHYEHRSEDHALYVFFAVSLAARPDLVGCAIRAAAIDEQAGRHELPTHGGTKGVQVVTCSWCLPYSQVAHGTVWYLGIEAQNH